MPLTGPTTASCVIQTAHGSVCHGQTTDLLVQDDEPEHVDAAKLLPRWQAKAKVAGHAAPAPGEAAATPEADAEDGDEGDIIADFELSEDDADDADVMDFSGDHHTQAHADKDRPRGKKRQRTQLDSSEDGRAPQQHANGKGRSRAGRTGGGSHSTRRV